MVTMLERVQAMLRGEAPAPPVAGLVGFRLVAVAPGSAVFEMEAGPQHANPAWSSATSRMRPGASSLARAAPV
jgi:acyl-coenzyme A thioesterase PaaI-like protein